MITTCLCLLLSGPGLQDTPSRRLEEVAARLEKLTDLRWDAVRDADEPIVTHVIARREPFRFRVSRSDPSESIVLGDANHVRAYDETGQVVAERPTFPTAARDVLSVVAAPQADFAATWQALLDPAYLKRIAAAGQVLDAGRDDVQGEACHVLLLNRAGQHEVYGHFHIAHYLWISDETGLPRASQQLRRLRGRTTLGPRYEMRELRPFEPTEDAYTFAGAKSDRSEEPKQSPKVEKGAAVGQLVPDVALHDRSGKEVRLSRFRGQPVVVTFWATWCAPRLQEFPHLEAIQRDRGEKLRIVAIATRDARLNVQDWMKAHETAFEVWMDADLGGESTPMTEAFDLEGAIPLSLLIDAEGRIVDRWRGYRDEAFWRGKVKALVD